MITDCKWLLSNLAKGLERFALLDDDDFAAYLRCSGGLFYAIGNGTFNSPYVFMVDDCRVDWGQDSITQLRHELRQQGLFKEGEALRCRLEKLLTEVSIYQDLAQTRMRHDELGRPRTLTEILGHNLVVAGQELQQEAADLLSFVLDLWSKLPADEPVTAGQLAKYLMKHVKGEWRPAEPREVSRELGKAESLKAVAEEPCAKLAGKTTKKWMRDSALKHFSSLEGWRTA